MRGWRKNGTEVRCWCCLQRCSESKNFYGDSGGGYPGWGRYGEGYRCWKCKVLSDATRKKCYREFREKCHARLQDQLKLLRRVLRAQSDRGWKAVLKGADLEKGEEGFISWMPFRHYGGKFGVMEALSMWRDYGLIEIDWKGGGRGQRDRAWGCRAQQIGVVVRQGVMLGSWDRGKRRNEGGRRKGRRGAGDGGAMWCDGALPTE